MRTPRVLEFDVQPLPVGAVIRRIGYPRSDHSVPENVKAILDAELSRAPDLMKGRCAYRIFAAVFNQEGVFLKEAGWTVRSLQVRRMLEGSEYAAVFMVTIGPDLEREVARLMQQGEMTRAWILDAVGSETVDEAANRVHHQIIQKEADTQGYTITPRFSPGYGDWPLSCQKEMLRVSGGRHAGIRVTDSFLMRPRKSVSALLGWKRGKTHE
ncbi:MAG TPA: hypothetical protein ENN03_01190 [bacterium]|nr:hypothetical protein [bacterium]